MSSKGIDMSVEVRPALVVKMPYEVAVAVYYALKPSEVWDCADSISNRGVDPSEAYKLADEFDDMLGDKLKEFRAVVTDS